MVPETMQEGDVAAMELRARRASTHKLVAGIVGAANAERAFKERAFRSLLLAVLHSDGMDQDAVRALRDAFPPPEKVMSFRPSLRLSAGNSIFPIRQGGSLIGSAHGVNAGQTQGMALQTA